LYYSKYSASTAVESKSVTSSAFLDGLLSCRPLHRDWRSWWDANVMNGWRTRLVSGSWQTTTWRKNLIHQRSTNGRTA